MRVYLFMPDVVVGLLIVVMNEEINNVIIIHLAQTNTALRAAFSGGHPWPSLIARHFSSFDGTWDLQHCA